MTVGARDTLEQVRGARLSDRTRLELQSVFALGVAAAVVRAVEETPEGGELPLGMLAALIAVDPRDEARARWFRLYAR